MADTLTPTARRWANLLTQLARSGLTLREFAAQRDLNASTLAWWRTRLRKPRPPLVGRFRAVEVPELVPVVAAARPLRVQLAGGRVVIEVVADTDLGQLGRVVEALS